MFCRDAEFVAILVCSFVVQSVSTAQVLKYQYYFKLVKNFHNKNTLLQDRSW